ncbi:MAG: hypothetical protein KAX31_05210 [Thermoplasmata archaeon]|nr:hypothetical protein [Thermoplasmata archaeon]
MSIIQFLVDEGVFVEDPDGLLWLSDEMKELVIKLERNEKFLDMLGKIEDPKERSLERWSFIYPEFGAGSHPDALGALVAWELAAIDQDLIEWSMKLRIR